jgi:hypothetical protein
VRLYPAPAQSLWTWCKSRNWSAIEEYALDDNGIGHGVQDKLRQWHHSLIEWLIPQYVVLGEEGALFASNVVVRSGQVTSAASSVGVLA